MKNRLLIEKALANMETVRKAARIAAGVYGITVADMDTKKRRAMLARRLFVGLLRGCAEMTTEQIAGLTGARYAEIERLLFDHYHAAEHSDAVTIGASYVAKYVEAVDLFTGTKGQEL